MLPGNDLRPGRAESTVLVFSLWGNESTGGLRLTADRPEVGLHIKIPVLAPVMCCNGQLQIRESSDYQPEQPFDCRGAMEWLEGC